VHRRAVEVVDEHRRVGRNRRHHQRILACGVTDVVQVPSTTTAEPLTVSVELISAACR
jgi:hypothetical protein